MKYDKVYKRDGRSPIPSDPQVSYTMSRIKGKNTKPEMAVRKALWARGFRGYRLHPKTVSGKPDITFIGRRVAIFVHGCYWHSCPHCKPAKPKSNSSWWKEKLEKNVERDMRKEKELKSDGWQVFTIWECRIKKNLDQAIEPLLKYLA